MPAHNIRPNVSTTFTPTVSSPAIDSTAFVHPLASVIGLVSLGRKRERLTVREVIKRETMKLRRTYNPGKGYLKKQLQLTKLYLNF